MAAPSLIVSREQMALLLVRHVLEFKRIHSRSAA